MAEELRWRMMEAEDLPKLGRLFGEVHGPEHEGMREDFLRWQYLEHPTGSAVVTLALCGEEIVGQYALLPLPLVLDGQPRKALLSLNTLTSPRFQRRGIFTKLAQMSYEAAKDQDYACVLGFPNRNSQPGFLGKLNFSLVGQMDTWVLFRRLGRIVRRKRALPGLGVVDAANKAWFKLRRVRSLGVRTAFSAETLKGLEALKPASDALFVQADEAWRNWRYGGSPVWSYDTVSVDGAAVVVRHIPGESSLLLDFFAAGGELKAEALRTLVAGAAQGAEEHDTTMVCAVLSPGHPAGALLQAMGFLRFPDQFRATPPTVIHLPLNEPLPSRGFGEWMLSGGSYDLG